MLDPFTIRHGDARALIADEPDSSIDVLVTSPPFWHVRNFSADERDQIGMEDTIDEFLDNLVDLFRRIRPKLAPMSTVFVEFGDAHNNGVVGRQDKNRLGTQNVSIASHAKGVAKKSLFGVPWRFAVRMIDDGWCLRNVIVWHRPSPTPESVRDRLTHSWTPVFLFSKNPIYYFNVDELRVSMVSRVYGSQIAWHDMVAGKMKGLADLIGVEPPSDDRWEQAVYKGNAGGRNPGDVWTIPKDFLPRGLDGDHKARYPEALVAMCLHAALPESVCATCNMPNLIPSGGQSCRCNPDRRTPMVFDPFCGSGTTLAVALKMRARALGYDIMQEYCDLSAQRCRMAWASGPGLIRPQEESRPRPLAFTDQQASRPTADPTSPEPEPDADADEEVE